MQQQQQQQQQHHSDFRAREIRFQTVSDLDLEAVGPTWADTGETCITKHAVCGISVDYNIPCSTVSDISCHSITFRHWVI